VTEEIEGRKQSFGRGKRPRRAAREETVEPTAKKRAEKVGPVNERGSTSSRKRRQSILSWLRRKLIGRLKGKRDYEAAIVGDGQHKTASGAPSSAPHQGAHTAEQNEGRNEKTGRRLPNRVLPVSKEDLSQEEDRTWAGKEKETAQTQWGKHV